MKRFLTAALACALLLALAVPAAAFEKIQRSTQRLMVDGVLYDCEMYNIDGKNYFKLRDLAYLLSGTGSQFDVDWDGAAKRVTLTTGHAYTTARGDELAVGEDRSDTAALTRDTLVIDGAARSDITACKIGDSNFFQLAELGSALGFGVDYDAETRTVLVASRAAEIQVTDLRAAAGCFIEHGGHVSRYSYALPRIDGADTEYIRAINAEMQTLWDGAAAAQLRHMEEDGWLSCYCVGYACGERNGVRSLLVTSDSDVGLNEYRCYNLDARGDLADNAAVLAAAGLTAADFLALARAYLAELTDLSAYFADDGWTQFQEDTLAPANLNADVPMAFLPNGDLCFICTVYTPAGAGYYDAAFAIAPDGTVYRPDVGRILHDRLTGTYLSEPDGAETATLYELFTAGDTLMLEITDLGKDEGRYSVFSYSATELFPEDPALLFRADADTLRVRAVSYYPDAFAGTYGGDAADWILSATPDGIALTDEHGGTVEARRCYRGDLGISEGLPEKDAAHFSYDAIAAAGLAGVWAGTYWDEDWQVHSLTLELTSGGEMRLRDTAAKALPRVYEGYFYIAGPEDDTAPAGSVVFSLARRGGYKMPLSGWCAMTVGADGALSIAEAADSCGHLTMLSEYEDAAVLRRVPAVRRVVQPEVRALAENERVCVDTAADGAPEEIACRFLRDADGGAISGLVVTVDGEPFEFRNLYTYEADVYLVTSGMSGAAWLYIDGLSDNDYHYIIIYGIRAGLVWTVGEYHGGFAAAPAAPERLPLRSRFHLVSTLNGVRACRVGADGYPEPVDAFYRVDSDLVLTAKTDIDGWRVDAGGGLAGSMTIPAGTALRPIRTDGGSATDLQLPDGSVCRVWSSGMMGSVNGLDVFDAFDGTRFGG